MIQHCSVQACTRERSHRNGMCNMHYQRWKRNGDPLVKRRARGVMDAPVIPKNEPKPKALGLGATQIRILRALAAGDVVSYSQMCAVIGGQRQQAVEQCVSSLRRRFGHSLIDTHRGQGYSAGPKLKALLR